MNDCTVCDDGFRNANLNKIICDGICRQVFHAECVSFNKDALIHYREVPNLQWFCDSCIIQIRSSNVSSPPFNKFNSTVVLPTSSPSYALRSYRAANRNRKPISSAKPATSSVLLATKSSNVNRDMKKASDSSSPSSKNEIRPENQVVNSPSAIRSHSPVTIALNHSDFAHPKQKHTADFKVQAEKSIVKSPDVDQLKPLYDSVDCIETAKKPPEHKSSKSFAEVIATSSIDDPVPTEVSISTTRSQDDSNQSQRTVSPSFETHKEVYVSKFHPSVTEEQVVNYLLRKNVITSAADVSCKKLVSPYADVDSISFISFKITVYSETFHSVVDSELWPEDIDAREIVR